MLDRRVPRMARDGKDDKSMKKIINVVSVCAVVLSAGITTLATPVSKVPVARHRQVDQQRRIGQGVRSGELTPKETIKLEREQKDIRQDIRSAKSDGVVTSAERQEIRADQNQASKDIYRLKHNNRHR